MEGGRGRKRKGERSEPHMEKKASFCVISSKLSFTCILHINNEDTWQRRAHSAFRISIPI
jgi:hypothetical protein